MNKKFLFTALISSPIIAFYGVMPFYAFDRLSPLEIGKIFVGITVNIFIAWLILFLLYRRFPKWGFMPLFGGLILGNLSIRLVMLVPFFLFGISPPPFVENEAVFLILTSFAISAVLVIILKLLTTSHQKTIVEREMQELKLQNIEARTKVLMQQLQPHFLFNSLSVLKYMIGENQYKAEEYVIKLGEFLRYSVQASTKEIVSLEEELQFVGDYIELQKGRFEDAFMYSLDVEESTLHMKLPVMALHTLVENIFKHNVFTKSKPLFFSIKTDRDLLIVENVKNSLKANESSQTGLANLNKRYELLARKSIGVEDSGDKFKVVINLLQNEDLNH